VLRRDKGGRETRVGGKCALGQLSSLEENQRVESLIGERSKPGEAYGFGGNVGEEPDFHYPGTISSGARGKSQVT